MDGQFTTDRTVKEEDLEQEYEKEVLIEDPNPVEFVSSLLKASENGTTKISEAVTDQSEVEKGAPHLIEITTEGWMTFDHHRQAYQHNGSEGKSSN